MKETFPEEFLRSTEQLFGAQRFACFIDAMDAEPPVSIRLNPQKVRVGEPGTPVPWCRDGFYLNRRPNFTFDPLLHAGCYYVQEAASQFIAHVASCMLASNGHSPFAMNCVLDLCAAPGGKSTAMRTVLPSGCLLVSNEPVRQRAQVLSENLQKWGHGDCVVTCNHARDFVSAGFREAMDMVVCDVPCSGEGMFRKDPDSIGEWSTGNVERCRQLQRQIVTDIWPCLRPGGIMVYSTCTYNVHENEENVQWLLEQTGAEIVAVPIRQEWGITGSLLVGFDVPVYRFIPGLTRSEGLFMAVLRKRDSDTACSSTAASLVQRKLLAAFSRLDVIHSSYAPLTAVRTRAGGQKGRVRQDAPTCAEALSAEFSCNRYPVVELPYHTAIAYLRREAITLLADTPTGYVAVAFGGHPLGFVKNIGTRANNLYPREWAIRSTYMPEVYDPVL